jgi:ADP-ribosylglycohydrolase
VTSNDVAEEWVAHIPFGWSAEYIALNNLRLGVFPPESGVRGNPFSEWIGAQMRGAVLGMVAPADPVEAARLAWIDGVISHRRNGVLGEVFNAVMVALAFVETDVRRLIQDAIKCIPEGTQYRFVVDTAVEACKQTPEWLMAWRKCEQEFKRYNWVHAYPNAAAEITALWYGNGNFDETMSIIGTAGQDVDCNAAQIATVLGVMYGPDIIGKRWLEPIHNDLHTYMRGMENIKITELANWTTMLIRKHQLKK